jgi:hypothetical protein
VRVDGLAGFICYSTPRSRTKRLLLVLPNRQLDSYESDARAMIMNCVYDFPILEPFPSFDLRADVMDWRFFRITGH